MEILGIVSPIFALIVTGFIFAQLKLLPQESGDRLIKFAYYILIPSLLFISIGQESIENLLDYKFLLVLLIGFIGLYLLVLLSVYVFNRKHLSRLTILTNCCIACSTGFVALPLLHAIFGHKAMLPAALANLAVYILLPITLVFMNRANELSDGQHQSFTEIMTGLAKDPVILSTVLSIGFAATPLTFPKVVINYFDLLTSAMTPVALFAIGFLINLNAFRNNRLTILFISIIKLIIFPVLIFMLAHFVGLSPLFTVAVTIAAASPTPAVTFIIAQQYNQSADMVSAIVSLTMLVCIVTLTLWLLIFSHFYPKLFSV